MATGQAPPTYYADDGGDALGHDGGDALGHDGGDALGDDDEGSFGSSGVGQRYDSIESRRGGYTQTELDVIRLAKEDLARAPRRF